MASRSRPQSCKSTSQESKGAFCVEVCGDCFGDRSTLAQEPSCLRPNEIISRAGPSALEAAATGVSPAVHLSRQISLPPFFGAHVMESIGCGPRCRLRSAARLRVAPRQLTWSQAARQPDLCSAITGQHFIALIAVRCSTGVG